MKCGVNGERRELLQRVYKAFIRNKKKPFTFRYVEKFGVDLGLHLAFVRRGLYRELKHKEVQAFLKHYRSKLEVKDYLNQRFFTFTSQGIDLCLGSI